MPTYRTTAGRVQEVLGDDYGPLADGSQRQVEPYLRGANLITTRVNECAAARGITLGSSELVEIETWVAAYLYTRSDGLYTSRSTTDASGSMARDTNAYLQGAYGLDFSGCLLSIMSGQRAGASWNGKRKSAQTDYVDRS